MGAAELFQIILAVTGTGALSVFITALFARRKINSEAGKTGADAAQVLSAASVALLGPMQVQLDIMDSRLIKTNAELESAQTKLTECAVTIAHLNKLLNYYRDKYGPPTDELARVETQLRP